MEICIHTRNRKQIVQFGKTILYAIRFFCSVLLALILFFIWKLQTTNFN